jgi:7-cyano-7-deazaguanine synthase in queuosine biosynthesis
MRKSKAIVLLSGGLDSTANYILAKKFFDQTQPVFFNYGQRAYINEKKAALASSKFFSDKLIEIDIRPVFANWACSVTIW